LKNTLSSSASTNFTSAQYLSDYYIQNASFLKMDNVSLGYTFDKVIKEIKSITVYATVQNPFVITKYKGLDPESYNGTDYGIDNNVYPRPRIYMLGLRVNL
jgi:TonB-dependent starch-binding outer membrane protein SusC